MSEWKKHKISDLIESNALVIGDGYRAKNSELSPDEGLPFARAGTINDGFQFEDAEYLAPENLHKVGEKISQHGDVLFTSKGTVGRIAFVTETTQKFVYSPQLTWWRVLDTQRIDPEFLYCWMRGREFISQINSFSGQTDMAAYVSLKDQRQMMHITLPEIKEQQEIAASISCLDRKIENLRKQNETLEAIAQTLFKHWFVDFEFPNADGKPYKSSGGAMEPSELGDIPAGWRVGTLGDEVETLGGSTPSTKEPDYWVDGDIDWYSPTDLTKSNTLFSLGSDKHITKLGLEKSSARLFPAYSILLTSRATIGEITINTKPACTNQGFITILPNEKFSVYFLHGWLLTQINLIKQLASGSTFPELSKSTFRKFLFLIPAPRQLENYDQAINPLFQKTENNTRQIQILTQTRDVLLPKLMSGKLRITS